MLSEWLFNVSFVLAGYFFNIQQNFYTSKILVTLAHNYFTNYYVQPSASFKTVMEM